MGCSCSDPLSVLILGVGSAGKTTILYRMKDNEIKTTIPTVGFVTEKFKVNDTELEFWDLGGQDKIRPLWKHYFGNASGVIFVIDAADSSLFQTVKAEIHDVANEAQITQLPIAVFANKQDLEGAINAEQIAEKMELSQIGKDRCCVFETSAMTGRGLKEGMTWLIQKMKNH